MMNPDTMWMLHTPFAKTILLLFLLTWSLILVNLFLLMLWFVHQIFGNSDRLKNKRRQ